MSLHDNSLFGLYQKCLQPPHQFSSQCNKEIFSLTEAHNMVPRSVQVVDHVVENSNKSSSNQRFIPCTVLNVGKGITLNERDPTVHEDHASKINSQEFDLPTIQFFTYQEQKCINLMYKI